MSDTNEYDNLIQSLKEAAVGLKALSQQAANEYAPIVESIIRTRSRDVADIERTLDGLLGFCGYWDLNPVNTASDINTDRCVSGKALAAGELRRATKEPAASASPLTEDLP